MEFIYISLGSDQYSTWALIQESRHVRLALKHIHKLNMYLRSIMSTVGFKYMLKCFLSWDLHTNLALSTRGAVLKRGK